MGLWEIHRVLRTSQICAQRERQSRTYQRQVQHQLWSLGVGRSELGHKETWVGEGMYGSLSLPCYAASVLFFSFDNSIVFEIKVPCSDLAGGRLI